MRLKGALTVLRKQADFFGMTLEEVIAFIERSPLAFPNSTIDAYEVYKAEKL